MEAQEREYKTRLRDTRGRKDEAEALAVMVWVASRGEEREGRTFWI